MLQNISKIFSVLYLAGFLITTPHIFAETESEDNSKNKIENKIGYRSLNRIENRFFTTLEQKMKMMDDIQNRFITINKSKNTTQRTPSSQQNNVEPIKIIVKSIFGEEGDRSAVIEFEGEEMTVKKDHIVVGKFKIIDIYPDRMVVYSNKEQRRRTYKMIKEEGNENTPKE